MVYMQLGLDAVLLLLLSLPIPLTYRVLPGETPYWLFGIYFLALILYVLIDQKVIKHRLMQNSGRFKLGLLWVCILIAGVAPLVAAIWGRIGAPPEYGVHDIILQTESAVRFLLDGVNPYATDYLGTPLGKFNYTESGASATNPALYHYVMPPGYLLQNVFLYVPFMSLFGFYDGRILNVAAYLGILLIVSLWARPTGKKLFMLIMVAFPPLMFHYLLEGRSDYPALFWLLSALFLLVKRKFTLSLLSLVIGLLTKQTIWFAVPFYLYYLWREAGREKFFDWKMWLWPMVVGATIIGPFIRWDARALWDSTVGFLIGTTVVNYPVAGYGWSMVLLQMGFIRDIHAYYPFIIWQALVCIPLGLVLFKWWRTKLTVGRFLIVYGVWLFGFWYFSRYFHNSHLTYLALVISLGLVTDSEEVT